MSNAARFEAISALIDGEPFDSRELADALSDAEGRELLIDLIALRHVVGDDTATVAASVGRPANHWRSLAAAAAIVVALAGGYAFGRTARPDPGNDAGQAPSPDRVIELRPGQDWTPLTGGR
jgi:anti-sigma-K factor RskA